MLVERKELTKRVYRFVKNLPLKKYICIGATLVVLVCGTLGGFYFQLGLNTGMATLVSVIALLISVALLITNRVLSSKDDYTRFLVLVYASKMDTQSFSSTKTLCKEIETALQLFFSGFTGFKSCLAENSALLSAMTTDCAAFEKYADRGIISKICRVLLNFCLSPFKYFALMDCILNGGGANNHNYRVMSSTRWYPIYSRYSSGILMWLIKTIGPIFGWLIGSNILVSVLDNMFDFSTSILVLIQFGLLSVVLQLYGLKGRYALLYKMAFDFVGNANPPVVPEANFDTCMAFANLSQYYYNACVEAGFIQNTVVEQTDKVTIESEVAPQLGSGEE